jgi:asparagine synthase (glutamine-hydrolysing)
MANRAARLGVLVDQKSIGACVLGLVRRKCLDGGTFLEAKGGGCHAVTTGEVFHVDRSQAEEREQLGKYQWLVEGYRVDGRNFFSRLHGTFAAAVWDEREHQLHLICDSRGDAHLFYRVIANSLVFASWMPLLAEPDQGLDGEAVKEFLRFFYISAPRTIYQGIARLEPGQCLTVANGQVTARWLDHISDESRGVTALVSGEEALDNFQKLFEAAVDRRVEHRRVGVFLSSGIDSSTLTVACQKINPGQVEAFTVGFDEPELDETHGARAFANFIGVPHRELRFSLTQYGNSFERMSRGFEQPYADPATPALILACEAMKDYAEVLLDGSGCDTLFGGVIPRHLWFSLVVSAKVPVALRSLISSSLRRRVFYRFLSRYVALFDFDELEELFITWWGWSKKELEELTGDTVSFEKSGFYRMFRTHQSMGAQHLYETLGVFPPEDCRFEAAALTDTTIGLPYYDRELFAYVRGLPQSFRISDGATKILLRELFARYFPSGAISCKKHYFNIPLQALLANSNFEIVREYLAPANLIRQGVVDSEKAWGWIRRYIAGDERLKFKIWSLLVLHGWLQERTKQWVVG